MPTFFELVGSNQCAEKVYVLRTLCEFTEKTFATEKVTNARA